MKKGVKILATMLGILLLLALLFAWIDFSRVQQGKSPLFSFRIAVYKDGGTKEYLGLGYKIIDYHKVNCYEKAHIGTWFLAYDNNLDGGGPFPVMGPLPLTNELVSLQNILNGIP